MNGWLRQAFDILGSVRTTGSEVSIKADLRLRGLDLCVDGIANAENIALLSWPKIQISSR